MFLDPDKIPAALVKLLPFVQKWGIGDDVEREMALSKAALEELYALIHSIDDISDDDFYGWLAGEESLSSDPSIEYLAVSDFAVAIDSARLEILKIKDGGKTGK